MPSLMDNEDSGPAMAPCFPGDGVIVYFMEHQDMVIVARLAPGDQLANIWSWRVGDKEWARNYAC